MNDRAVDVSIGKVGNVCVVSIEDVGLFFGRWDVLAIVGEDGFVSVWCVIEFVVEYLYVSPELRCIGSEVDFG